MTFEKHIISGKGCKDFKPMISIWASGQISFNKTLITLYSLNKYKYALFYFEAETYRIGVQFTDEQENGVKKVTEHRRGGISISAKFFLKTYEINYKKTKRYPSHYDEKTDMFIFDVSKAIKK